MDVYVVRGDRPSVAVSWDARGPLAVLSPAGLSESWTPPDFEHRILSDAEQDKRDDAAWEEAEGIGWDNGRKDGRNEAADIMAGILDEFHAEIPQDVRDEIRDKITAALAN